MVSLPFPRPRSVQMSTHFPPQNPRLASIVSFIAMEAYFLVRVEKFKQGCHSAEVNLS